MVLLVGLAALVPAAVAGEPKAPGAPEKTLDIYLDESEVLDTPWPVKRVSVTQPAVADVKVLTPRQVLVQGKASGSTDLILWSEDEQVLRYRVDVNVDMRRMAEQLKTLSQTAKTAKTINLDLPLLAEQLKALFPTANLDLSESQGNVVVRGAMDTADHAAELHRFFEVSGIHYVDLARLAGIQQVMIKVRVAEVSRSALRVLGINAFGTGHDFFAGSTIAPSGGTAISPISIGVPGGASAITGLPFQFTADAAVGQSVTLFAGFPRANLEVFLQALAENQYLRVLAEPTLVALSGEEASFLAGGEYPIPVVQGTSVGGAATISVEYRQFGVRLKFRPIVLGDGGIQLRVEPEVSQLSSSGAVEIQGFRIPALTTRRTETTLRLQSGQTFAMAGLISHTVSARVSRVPGLGDIPVLGALFRSVRYQNDETELVVLVTASLVEPQSLASMPPLPGEAHVPPNDWELYAEGRIEGQTAGRLSADDAARLKAMGLDRLVGPGAWATYEQEPAPSRATPAPPAPATASAAEVPTKDAPAPAAKTPPEPPAPPSGTPAGPPASAPTRKRP
jgi:pilus assembly protein CpaC